MSAFGWRLLILVALLLAVTAAIAQPAKPAPPQRHGTKPARCESCHPPYDICLPPCLKD